MAKSSKPKQSSRKGKQQVKTPVTPPSKNRFVRMIESPRFAKIYLGLSCAILFGTTVLWSALGAGTQHSNADQLVDPYLFENGQTFHDAIFPGQHTFLIKWPLFWLLKLFQFSPASFTVATVGLSLATVLGFAWLLSRIDRRPLMLGTMLLALASTLLLIPSEPYPGGILPVNMAMVTTRNIEYLIYLGALILILRRTRFLRDIRWWIGIGLLGLLIASDRLFMTFTLGGAGVLLAVYILAHKWKTVHRILQWIVASVIATMLGLLLLFGLTKTGILHLSHNTDVSPYIFIHSLHDAKLGVVYGIFGFFTNFGANPGYDALVIRDMPHHIATHVLSWGGLAYIVNFVVCVVALFAAVHIFLGSLRRSKNDKQYDHRLQLGIASLGSTVAAIGVFVATQHYYLVDARYLAIGFFALFLSLSLYIRNRNWHAKRIVLVGLIMMFSITSGIFGALQNHHAEGEALDSINDRNETITEALRQHPVTTVVGDYWRVLPIKESLRATVNAVPMNTCTEPRDTLTSTAWQKDLTNHSFAYVLTFDKGLTGYKPCSLQQIIDVYGRPNNNLIIDGTFDSPKEMLLFYDNGTNHPSPGLSPTRLLSTITPTASFSDLDHACSSPTIMQVVAHQDDDLLFMNPDLQHAIKAGDCIRTLYITAGDSGNNKLYWLSREKAVETAYDFMIGPTKDVWIHQIVKLKSGQIITIAHPKMHRNVSLIYFRLPDGSPTGQGFRAHNHESLAKLESRAIPLLHSVDGESKFNVSDLTSTLSDFMAFYQPGEIHTQANVISREFPDHSDHMAVGRLTTTAYHEQYGEHPEIPISYYVGYPIRALPKNVSGDDLRLKTTMFLLYGNIDNATCNTIHMCEERTVYGSFLPRQYTSPY